MSSTDYPMPKPRPADDLDGPDGFDGSNKRVLGTVLEELKSWHARFIGTTSEQDLNLIVLFEAVTHVCMETYTVPLIVIDSISPGSGKTTLLDHMERFTADSVSAASLSSPAMLARLLKNGPRTVLIDEAHRTLDPKNPATNDLLSILNSCYKRGKTRPVLTPIKGGDWEVVEMPTYAPVVMAGNAPNLADDTRQRSIRLLLMPDDQIEDSDWEVIEQDAQELAARLREAMGDVRALVKDAVPDLPEKCKGRIREKWRPLARVADVAGGPWPERVRELIMSDIEEIEAERADGITKQPPAVILMRDVHEVWPEGETFMRTRELVNALVMNNPDYWGEASPYGRALTVQRLGRLLNQSAKIHSSKNSCDERGYRRNDFALVWRRMGIEKQNPSSDGSTDTHKQTVETVGNGETVERDDVTDVTEKPDHGRDLEQEPLSLDEEYALALEAQEQGKEN